MLEVEEVLAALRHHLQVGQQVQKLGEFVLRFREGRERRWEINISLIVLERRDGQDLSKVA